MTPDKHTHELIEGKQAWTNFTELVREVLDATPERPEVADKHTSAKPKGKAPQGRPEAR